MDAGDGQHRYELLGPHGPHIHLVCQRCGTLIGVEREVVGFEALGPEADDPALNLTPGAHTKQDLALLEEESATVCVTMDMMGNITIDPTATPVHIV